MYLENLIQEYDRRETEYMKTGFLKKGDWEILCKTIHDYGCTKIMEFGTGTSTRLFYDCGINCLSYEQDPKYLKKLQASCPNADIRLWGGKNVQKDEYDLIFIDGPWCTPKGVFRTRGNAFVLSRNLSPRFVAMHDMDLPEVYKLRVSLFRSWPAVFETDTIHVVRNPHGYNKKRAR